MTRAWYDRSGLPPTGTHGLNGINARGSTTKFTSHLVDLVPISAELSKAGHPTDLARQKTCPLGVVSLTLAFHGKQSLSCVTFSSVTLSSVTLSSVALSCVALSCVALWQILPIVMANGNSPPKAQRTGNSTASPSNATLKRRPQTPPSNAALRRTGHAQKALTANS